MNINLDYVNARRALLPMGNKLGLYLIGCGGNGSWLAPAVARIARMASEKGQEVRVTFIDPDIVEEKNCYRQNFSFAEIGRNKAETLAYRYGLAWGVDIRAIPTRFEHNKDTDWDFRENNLNLLIGCVDRASGRRAIHRYITEYNGYNDKRWWLDCGNEQSTGQILLGNVSVPKPEGFGLQGFCSMLPLPGIQHPELLNDQPEVKASEENLSCADLVLVSAQGMSINQRIAAEAADYLVRLLITRNLTKFRTYLDLESGSARSDYIVPEKILPQQAEASPLPSGV